MERENPNSLGQKVKGDTTSDQNVQKQKFTCVLCNKQYGRKHDLQRHISIVHLSVSDGLRLHKCPKCSYSTAHKRALNRHNIVHAVDKANLKTKKCEYCDKCFISNFYLTRHVRAVHNNINGEGRTTIPVEESNKKKHTCNLCDKQYFWKGDLQRHVKNVHNGLSKPCQLNKCPHCSFTTSYLTSLKRHTLTQHKATTSSHETLQCEYCKSVFNHEGALKYHLKKYHTSVTQTKTIFRRKCCICLKVLYGYHLEGMRSHFENVHNIPMKWEFHSFNSMTEFDIWKKSVEKETTSSYILQRSSKSKKVYKCHRSGNYTKKGHNKRELKMAGSCKINNICPSVIKVNIQQNNISVKYLSSHVGHKNELKHIRLTPEERQLIAKQLVEKIPHDVVLKKIRGSATNVELQRINLTNKKDLINIEQSFNINEEAIKHSFDVVSIEAWVAELKLSKDTALIAYKPQGEIIDDFPHLKKEDFLLIFMSEAQKTMLQKLGQDVICIDGTHGVNNYNFQLYTLLTIDETREGFPAAFMFTNKGDECTLQTFFEHIKRVTGTINCKIFMSDMEETFYSAWKKVMGLATARLFCTWHVLKAWRVNVNNKIRIKENRDFTKQMLQTVLYETDETEFLNMLQGLLAKFAQNTDTQLFGEYFQKQYVDNDRFKTWAYCYRINAGINTNMSLENFNRVLKHCYLRGKKVKGLEKTLCAVLTLLKEKLFDLLIKMYRGKLVRKLQFLRKRHRTSLSLNLNSVSQLDVQRWQVLSSKCSDLYTVQRITTCNNCSLKCTHCDTCLHEFVCSCIDSCIRNNMCKHIHLVMRSQGNNHRQDQPSDNIGDTLFLDYDEDEQDIQDAIMSEISHPLTDNLNEHFEWKKKRMIEDLNAYLMRNITTPDHMETCKKMFKTLTVTIDAMTAASSRHIEDACWTDIFHTEQ